MSTFPQASDGRRVLMLHRHLLILDMVWQPAYAVAKKRVFKNTYIDAERAYIDKAICVTFDACSDLHQILDPTAAIPASGLETALRKGPVEGMLHNSAIPPMVTSAA